MYKFCSRTTVVFLHASHDEALYKILLKFKISKFFTTADTVFIQCAGETLIQERSPKETYVNIFHT